MHFRIVICDYFFPSYRTKFNFFCIQSIYGLMFGIIGFAVVLFNEVMSN